MNPHNPASIDPSLVGPNHRLLNVEELSKPLPEGAEYASGNRWVDSIHGVLPQRHLTYRIPLTLRDRIQREIEEKQELLKVVEAVENGTAEYEHDYGRYDWYKPSKGNQTVESLELFVNKGFKVRIKSTPRTIPWTLERHPDVVCVEEKETSPNAHYNITVWKEKLVYLDTLGWITYTELHDHWQQRNGDVAGERVEA